MGTGLILGIESLSGVVLREFRLDGLLRKLHGPKIPILMYHSIGADASDGSACLSLAGMTVSESRFRQHMRYVAAHYQTITLSDYVRCRRDRDRLPDHPCIITFDDGFQDFYERAMPVLKEYGLKAVVFVIGSTLRPGGRGSWLHDLYTIIDGLSFQTCSEAMAKAVRHYPSRGIRSRAELRKWAGTHFISMEPSEREDLFRRLRADLGVNRPHAHMFLDEHQLQEMAGEGFEIGAHSMHHELMSKLTGDRLKAEIVECNEVIESAVGSRPLSFCYPFGGLRSWDDRTVKELRENGFSCAVSTVEGFNDGKTDLYALRRIRLTGDIPLSIFVFRVLGLRSFLWKLQEVLYRMRRRFRS